MRAGKIDYAGDFTVVEVKTCAELARKRAHRLVMRSGGDAQPRVAGALCFGEQQPDQFGALGRRERLHRALARPRLRIEPRNDRVVPLHFVGNSSNHGPRRIGISIGQLAIVTR